MCAGTLQRRIVSCKRDALLIVCSYFSSPAKFVAVCVVHILLVFACTLTKRMDDRKLLRNVLECKRGHGEQNSIYVFFFHETCAISVIIIVIIIMYSVIAVSPNCSA